MKPENSTRQKPAGEAEKLSDGTFANQAEKAFERSGQGLREENPQRDNPDHQRARRLEPK